MICPVLFIKQTQSAHVITAHNTNHAQVRVCRGKETSLLFITLTSLEHVPRYCTPHANLSFLPACLLTRCIHHPSLLIHSFDVVPRLGTVRNDAVVTHAPCTTPRPSVSFLKAAIVHYQVPHICSLQVRPHIYQPSSFVSSPRQPTASALITTNILSVRL